MKTTIYWIIALIVTGWSCNTTSGRTANAITKEDSLEYYPPTPVQLDQKQFRNYYRILSRYFDSTLLRRNFNGGILVAKEGQIVYENYTGFSDLRTKDPLTDSTSMHLASTGKTFTGMAILQMVQQNQISLSDPL
jgi:CubicO group peptidase (beta-lactamase class C family)